MEPQQKLWLTRAGYVVLGVLFGMLIASFMRWPAGECLPAGTSSSVVVGIDTSALPA